jgi:poly(A) polymerase
VFVHTALVLDRLAVPEDDPDERDALLWGALLHDVGKPPTRTTDPDGRIRFNGHDAVGAELAVAILQRLRVSNRVTERVADLVGAHMTFPNLPKMRASRLRRFLGAEAFPLHLALHRADCGASHGDLSLVAFCEERLRSYADEPVLPPPLLRGGDLLTRGYRPGPRIGRILEWVRELQLDGQVHDVEEAVRRVLESHPPDDPEAGTE